MISAVGVRNLVEDSVDFNSSRNVFVAASILVIAIGVKYGAEDSVSIGPIHFSGLALAALVARDALGYAALLAKNWRS